MNVYRLISTLLISIGLFTSTSLAAFSQGHMAGSQSITICSPDGVHDIVLGANGEPVPSEHECDDCCFFAMDATAAPETISPLPLRTARTDLQIASQVWVSRTFTTTRARSPPPLV